MGQDDRDDLILEERLAGNNVRAIAKRHRCSSSEVEAVIDQRLASELDNAMRLKAIKLDIARLEGLMAPFYERATKDRDVAAGTLCVKILERRALLLGLDSPTRVDIVQMQAQTELHEFDRIHAAILRIARPGWRPDGGNGDVGVMSDSGENETSD